MSRQSKQRMGGPHASPADGRNSDPETISHVAPGDEGEFKLPARTASHG